jgi:hypothetical protein
LILLKNPLQTQGNLDDACHVRTPAGELSVQPTPAFVFG